jgi:hypothetical protein
MRNGGKEERKVTWSSTMYYLNKFSCSEEYIYTIAAQSRETRKYVVL